MRFLLFAMAATKSSRKYRKSISVLNPSLRNSRLLFSLRPLCSGASTSADKYLYQLIGNFPPPRKLFTFVKCNGFKKISWKKMEPQ